MISRIAQYDIEKRLQEFPAVALHGARQIGKTTLAREIRRQVGGRYFDLEDQRDQILLRDSHAFFSDHRGHLVVIDEAQRMPEIFPALRVAIDADRRPGRFLLLGSASPSLSRQASESLAGRLAIVELNPLVCSETEDPAMLSTLWLRGGFPLSYLAEREEQSMVWRKEYLRNFFERDLRMLGFDLAPARMQSFFAMLAHTHGQLWNGSQIARSLGIGTTTARRYLDALAQTYLVHVVVPYYSNLGKRIRRAPKAFVADTGLLHALLDLREKIDLMRHPVLGLSWEGFVLQHLRAHLPLGWEVSFWRTAGGAEIDLLLLRGGLPAVAIEAKANSTDPRPRRGFRQSCDDLNIQHRWIVYPGEDEFILRGEMHVLPLPMLIERVREMAQ